MTELIDLDAERREIQYPEGIPVRLRGETYVFPAELPADVLDPLFDPELDLMGLFAKVVQSTDNTVAGEVVDILLARPNLLRQFKRAMKEVYRELLGDDYERFDQTRPSVADYVRLSKALGKAYGVELGKLFGLPASSESTGEPSNPTSPATTNSMLEGSGSAPADQGSSASAA